MRAQVAVQRKTRGWHWFRSFLLAEERYNRINDEIRKKFRNIKEKVCIEFAKSFINPQIPSSI